MKHLQLLTFHPNNNNFWKTGGHTLLEVGVRLHETGNGVQTEWFISSFFVFIGVFDGFVNRRVSLVPARAIFKNIGLSQDAALLEARLQRSLKLATRPFPMRHGGVLE